MDELTREFGDLAGRSVYLKAWIYDWFWQETINGTHITKVYKDEIIIRALGKRFRPFKPETTFDVIVSYCFRIAMACMNILLL